MPPSHGPRNRGPAAAPENRAAILAAARRLFAEQGYRVPLSTIARAAGVSQGVMYRHFPERLQLAYAVFSDNFLQLEELAARTEGPECFGVLWRRLVEDVIASTALVEMVIDARATVPEASSEQRLVGIIAEPLARAQRAGLADPAWTPDDVLLMLLMVYGVASSHPDADVAAADMASALRLVDPRLIG